MNNLKIESSLYNGGQIFRISPMIWVKIHINSYYIRNNRRLYRNKQFLVLGNMLGLPCGQPLSIQIFFPIGIPFLILDSDSFYNSGMILGVISIPHFLEYETCKFFGNSILAYLNPLFLNLLPRNFAVILANPSDWAIQTWILGFFAPI